MNTNLRIPICNEDINNLVVGDTVHLSGIMITGRDVVHKWLYDTFIIKSRPATEEDQLVYQAIKPILKGGLIYHCGPVVGGLESKEYRFVAAGPTTSIREEPYQSDIMQHFGMKGAIGKGGMGHRTLKACQEIPAVYFHAIGGAAALIAQSVKQVIAVHKLEFGVPEAIWVIEVVNRGFQSIDWISMIIKMAFSSSLLRRL
ncbi:MAG: fumarate hydratase C-terminal domain-containing protein [Chloroflexi bacterium]|nr:fumarate hydratase C-terminal domain-containing protein [Chloroflexota bacterium]